MTVRVRFAPSPTGYLHVGGARTALYCYLYAKRMKGTFLLRIEDTDTERSKKEYEESQIKDLEWLGLKHNEGPDLDGGHGPYRQSERRPIYTDMAQQLIDKNLAFHCFCSEEILKAKKEQAEANNLAPIYDGTCRHLKKEEVESRLANGEKAVIRFKAYEKDYTFSDLVRGEVSFPKGMVGDFVIVKSDGGPVYNYSCVADDYLMKVSHVIRAEEHLPNTLRQLMLYEALDATPPLFAHVSLILGNDRQKLSKRHGATSVSKFREEGYLPEALINYLSLLGWSHPEEKDILTEEEIISVFGLERFNKAPAVFDYEKLSYINGQHLRMKDEKELLNLLVPYTKNHFEFNKKDESWKLKAIAALKVKLTLLQDFVPLLDFFFSDQLQKDDDLKDICSWETTKNLALFWKEKLENRGDAFITEEEFKEWSNVLKKEHKIKGKPLFMGMRGVLTGRAHGPELLNIIPLTEISILKKRVTGILEIL